MLNFLIFILIVSILIIVHEFGHYWIAKKNKVKVEKFAIGFGKPLFTIKGKETDFLICAFPLGGYVKLAGDSKEDFKGLSYEFLSKSPFTKIKIVFSGPLFNYIFAFLIFFIVALVGFPHIDTVVGNLKEGYPAQLAGLKTGDRILSINGKETKDWLSMVKLIRKSKDFVSVSVKRDTQIINLKIPLKQSLINDEIGIKKNVPVIGIEPSNEIKIIRYSIFKAPIKALEALFDITFFIFRGLFFLILGRIPFKEAATGLIGVYYFTSESLKYGLVALLSLMANLNISLAIVNLFPLPLLDGFNILIFLWEKITKKQISAKSENFLVRLGFVMLIFLAIVVFYNDIIRFGPKIFEREKISDNILKK